MSMKRAIVLVVAAVWLALSHGACGQGVLGDATLERIPMTKALVIERAGGGGGRSSAAVDAVQRLIVTGQWKTPKAGDEITLGDGSTRAWSEAEAGNDGTLPAQSTRAGYALWVVESDEDKIMLLNASGHGMAYINGEPRAGDPYANGIVSLPVKLRKGVNEILLQCPRGAVKAELVELGDPIALRSTDATLPDLARGSDQECWGGVVVVNATGASFKPLTITCEHAGGMASVDDVPPIPAMSARKVPIRIPRLPRDADAGTSSVRVRIVMLGPSVGDRAQLFEPLEVELAVVDALSLQKRTFVSDIDGSVQYFAVRPALKDAPDNGLILTLHGAGVEARGQAAAYKSKEWAHIVAPTNRRPYGFDWEDWGRIDAMEVLDIAKSDLAHDPQRIYLTGHSMGGHGTWQVGSTFPGEFAAIAPSAGWISFESYGGGRGGGNRNADNADAMQQIMRRAGNSSRTLELQHNLNGLGIYILHGDKDDNVPVEQARTMKAELEKWHHDLEYHEQPGAGHWWGDECVDWPPLMEFLSKHGRPAAKAIDHVQFATASPGVNASRDWVTIQQQQRCMDFSRVDLKRDLTKRTISGTTENVARITLDVSDFEGEGEITVELDGQSVRAQASRQAIELERNGDKWGVAAAPLAPSHKTPARCGPFKSAFNHRFMFVYGTKGTAEENAWAFKKARFDAETFWYRGNGSVDVVADVDFNPRDNASRDRSVILYGNADTNAVWDALLHDSPVQVHRGQIKMSDRAMNGDDLACLMIRPRPGSDIASVGVVSGTGAIGARITDRLPYFVSGVAYPDCIVFDGSGLARGGLGIRAAGYFGNDWSIEHGEFGWQQ